MAIEFRSCSDESRAVVYQPTVAEEDPNWPQLIKQYELERKAGLEIIRQLKGRLQNVSEDLKDERVNYNISQEQHEAQLFAERQRSSLLERELAAAKEQVQRLTANVSRMEEQLEHNAKVIIANRAEIVVLSRRVVELTEQLAESIKQESALQAEGNALRARLIEKETYTNELQRQILQGQQEKRRDNERLTVQPSKARIVRIYEYVRDTLFGKNKENI